MNERLFNLGLKRFKDRGEKERAIRGKRDLRADWWVGGWVYFTCSGGNVFSTP